jgi:hypothetical protein
MSKSDISHEILVVIVRMVLRSNFLTTLNRDNNVTGGILASEDRKFDDRKFRALTARIFRSRTFLGTCRVAFISNLSSRIFCLPRTSVSPRAHHCQVVHRAFYSRYFLVKRNFFLRILTLFKCLIPPLFLDFIMDFVSMIRVLQTLQAIMQMGTEGFAENVISGYVIDLVCNCHERVIWSFIKVSRGAINGLYTSRFIKTILVTQLLHEMFIREQKTRCKQLSSSHGPEILKRVLSENPQSRYHLEPQKQIF